MPTIQERSAASVHAVTHQDGLKTNREGPVLTLTLDRPHKHHALDATLLRALDRALRDARASPTVRVVLLKSSGPTFCAGADITWMRDTNTRGSTENEGALLASVLQGMRRLPQPILAVAEGRAIGGGVGLLAAADGVVMDPEATLRFSEVRLGLAPAVIAPHVIRRTGPAPFARLALLGEPIPAALALELGLVDWLAPKNEIAAVVESRIKSFLLAAPEALAAVKQLSAPDADLTPDATLALLSTLRASPSGQEGMRAFSERRPPSWAIER